MASEQLMKWQLVLLGKVLRSPEEDPLRASSLIGDTWQPAATQHVRKVDRPRKEWITIVKGEACRRFGSMDRGVAMAEDAKEWKRTLHDSEKSID